MITPVLEDGRAAGVDAAEVLDEEPLEPVEEAGTAGAA